MYTHCICLSRLRYNSPLYRLPTLPILPVNSFIFTILPVNLKHGKSSTLTETEREFKKWKHFGGRKEERERETESEIYIQLKKRERERHSVHN